MNKLNALNTEGQEIILGQTEVLVKKRVINEQTGRETINTVHKGIVVGELSKSGWLRVFNNAPLDKGGDVSQDTSEWFPRNSPMCWCEIVGCRRYAIRLSPTL